MSFFPSFFTWLDYNSIPEEEFYSLCVAVEEAGIEGVILKANCIEDYKKAITVLREPKGNSTVCSVSSIFIWF
jgi:hypothetical protein